QDVAVPGGAQRERVGDLPAERLDPVQVVYVQPEQGAADDVGKPGGEALAVTPPLPPAGDQVVALVELVEQQRDVDLGGGLEVGGGENDPLAPGPAAAAA